MLEDEEILCEGNSLYQHLIDLGYSDFETFENNSSFCDAKVVQIEKNESNTFRSHDTLPLANKDYGMLLSILNSQLVFKEDSSIVESAISDISVSEKSKFWKIYTTILSGLSLMSSTLAFKKKTGFLLSSCLTFVCSGYLTWTFINSYFESKQVQILESYLLLSRKLYLNIHKHLRFLNECQILMASKLQTDRPRIEKFLYNNSSNQSNGKSEAYPHLRKCLFDSLTEIISIITHNRDSLRNSKNLSLLIDNYCLSDLNNPKDLIGKIMKGEDQITIDVLRQLTELYLILQSEYLRDLGLILLPVTENLSTLRSLALKETFRQLTSCQTKLADINFKLSVQFKLHNIFLDVKPNDNVVGKVEALSRLEVFRYDKHLHFRNVKMDIHNIFLLLYSALLRVKNLEDYLETLESINEKEQNHSELVTEISKQMSILQGDLTCTVSCFDVISKQIISASTTQENNPVNSDKESPKSESAQEVKETVFLGKTDFSVNSLDEVFLAISDLNPCKQSDNFDDWGLERRPRIPKNLLTELSNTLKLRKEDFIERERVAVERQGLQDLERKIVAEDSSDEDSVIRAYSRTKKSTRNKLNFESNSDSEGEEFKTNDALEKKAKLAKTYKNNNSNNSSISDLSSGEDAIDEGHLAQNLLTDNSSLANLIALKSQMWGNKSEDFYSDG